MAVVTSNSGRQLPEMGRRGEITEPVARAPVRVIAHSQQWMRTCIILTMSQRLSNPRTPEGNH